MSKEKGPPPIQLGKALSWIFQPLLTALPAYPITSASASAPNILRDLEPGDYRRAFVSDLGVRHREGGGEVVAVIAKPGECEGGSGLGDSHVDLEVGSEKEMESESGDEEQEEMVEESRMFSDSENNEDSGDQDLEHNEASSEDTEEEGRWLGSSLEDLLSFTERQQQQQSQIQTAKQAKGSGTTLSTTKYPPTSKMPNGNTNPSSSGDPRTKDGEKEKRTAKMTHAIHPEMSIMYVPDDSLLQQQLQLRNTITFTPPPAVYPGRKTPQQYSTSNTKSQQQPGPRVQFLRHEGSSSSSGDNGKGIGNENGDSASGSFEILRESEYRSMMLPSLPTPILRCGKGEVSGRAQDLKEGSDVLQTRKDDGFGGVVGEGEDGGVEGRREDKGKGKEVEVEESGTFQRTLTLKEEKRKQELLEHWKSKGEGDRKGAAKERAGVQPRATEKGSSRDRAQSRFQPQYQTRKHTQLLSQIPIPVRESATRNNRVESQGQSNPLQASSQTASPLPNRPEPELESMTNTPSRTPEEIEEEEARLLALEEARQKEINEAMEDNFGMQPTMLRVPFSRLDERGRSGRFWSEEGRWKKENKKDASSTRVGGGEVLAKETRHASVGKESQTPAQATPTKDFSGAGSELTKDEDQMQTRRLPLSPRTAKLTAHRTRISENEEKEGSSSEGGDHYPSLATRRRRLSSWAAKREGEDGDGSGSDSDELPFLLKGVSGFP